MIDVAFERCSLDIDVPLKVRESRKAARSGQHVDQKSAPVQRASRDRPLGAAWSAWRLGNAGSKSATLPCLICDKPILQEMATSS